MSRDCDLSVLVLTVPSRVSTYFPALVGELVKQSRGRAVEVLGLFDNKVRSVGEKRNALVQLAQGRFCAFVDDDDAISEDYIHDIFLAIDEHPDADVICFRSVLTENEKPPKLCKYSVTYGGYLDGPELWRGLPAHTMVWRSQIAKACRFPASNFREDVAWVMQAIRHVRKEVQIEKVLYHYRLSNAVTETRIRA